MPADPSARELLAGCVAAVHAAGIHALKNLHRRTDAVEVHRHDVKLRLDVECQQAIERTIEAHFPGHRLLGEEQTGREPTVTDSPYEWIVDPIDGTVNFSHSVPLWCSSVAVRKGDTLLAGAVYAPEIGELYTASAEEPARLNGRAIHVSTTTAIDRALIYSGLSKHTAGTDYQRLIRISETVSKVRMMGAAALDLCRVARGNGDGYFESGIHIWDSAAGGLIVERAGGRVEVLGEAAGGPHAFLATNGHLHAALRATVLGTRPGPA